MKTVIEWTKNIGTVAKAITGVAAVFALIVTGLLFYMPRSAAEAAHEAIVNAAMAEAQMYAQAANEARSRLVAYDELGKLETDIQLKELEIKQITGTRERRDLTPDEESDLELAQGGLLLLQQRLRDLQTSMKEDSA